jgi:predicted transposase YdaD
MPASSRCALLRPRQESAATTLRLGGYGAKRVAKPKGPHDAFVKYTFSNLENAAATLRSVLPQGLSQRIDWQSLRLESGSHVDHLLSDTHTDLLFSTSIAGRRALLYVLFEHQSTSDALMPFRLLKYIVRVLDWHLENAKAIGHTELPLPLIVPVVLHHSKGGWKVPPSTFFEQVQLHAPEATETLMTIAEQLQAKGRAEGRAEAKVSAILAVLEARQKAVTAEQRARIEACSDLGVLDRWLRKAATLTDTGELFELPE